MQNVSVEMYWFQFHCFNKKKCNPHSNQPLAGSQAVASADTAVGRPTDRYPHDSEDEDKKPKETDSSTNIASKWSTNRYPVKTDIPPPG